MDTTELYVETAQEGDLSSIHHLIHHLIDKQADKLAFAREVLATPAPGGVDDASWRWWTQAVAEVAGLTPVFVVGRHAPDLGDSPVFIVGSAAPTFALNRAEVAQQLIEIEHAANAAGAKHILLQNVPAAVAGALIAHLGRTMSQWGVVVSVPGERQAGASQTFEFQADPDGVDPWARAEQAVKLVEQAVKFVNARATTVVALPGRGYGDNYISSVTVTCDPVPSFVFSHIDWLNTPPTSNEQRPENVARWIREVAEEIPLLGDEMLDGIWEGKRVVIALPT
jgi:hypothetical protein